MSNGFVFVAMIFCHIVDDYYLQGILASLKQKTWWEKHDSFYQYDYIAALICHGLSWAFMVMLPIAISLNFQITGEFIIFWFIMAMTHAYIDDLKANIRSINLCHDQLLHLCQIVIIFIAYFTGIV